MANLVKNNNWWLHDHKLYIQQTKRARRRFPVPADGETPVEMLTSRYNPVDIKWHRIREAPDASGYVVDYEYAVLGYDLASGRMDMMMRFGPGGGHCERHAHTASTTTLILEGEQHLEEVQPDGSIKDIVRKAGDYALARLDALPHSERGGPEGCVLLLSLQAPDGIVFKAYDAAFDQSIDISIEDFVARYRDAMALLT